MDRREFLSTLVGGVSVNAAVRTWPFRVFSFPTELRIFSMEELRRIYVERAMAEISRDMADSPLNGVASILLPWTVAVEDTDRDNTSRHLRKELCSLPPDLAAFTPASPL